MGYDMEFTGKLLYYTYGIEYDDSYVQIRDPNIILHAE